MQMNNIPSAFLEQGKENINWAPFRQIGPFILHYNGQENYDLFKRKSEWNQEQKSRYVMLLELNMGKIENREHKNLWQIYKHMAKRIGTRNFVQCKLFHQKMLKQEKSISRIISCLTEDPEVEGRVEEMRKMIIEQRRARESQKQISSQLLSTSDIYLFQFKEQGKQENIEVDKKYREDTLEQCQERFNFWSNKLKNLVLPALCI